MKFYTRFDPAPAVNFDNSQEPSLVRQSEAESCDINKIMERFNRTGKLPLMQTAPPNYGDARVVDYQTAQNLIKEAQDQFNSLPALTRKAFGNDPQAFLSALEDYSEDNAQKLLKLGVIIKREPTPEEVLMRIAENTKPSENPSA